VADNAKSSTNRTLGRSDPHVRLHHADIGGLAVSPTVMQGCDKSSLRRIERVQLRQTGDPVVAHLHKKLLSTPVSSFPPLSQVPRDHIVA
jgi:hypothetical protein